MKQETRLYNVLFPVWLMYLWPTALWLLILPGNFLIDSAVLLLAMKAWGMAGKGQVWKKSILPVWLIGFGADLIGGGVIYLVTALCDALLPEVNVFLSPGGQLAAIPGILAAGGLIYLLNRRFSFRKAGLSQEDARRLSLALAIFTAPYTMLIPIEWLYG